jgi:hypothetical protein
MYLETRSQTITEAIDKLYALKTADLVYHADSWGLTEAQKTELNEYLNWIDYTRDDATEDRKLALENCYVNLTDDHIYVLEMADGENDTVEYYFTELVPNLEAEPKLIATCSKGELYKNTDGTYEMRSAERVLVITAPNDEDAVGQFACWLCTRIELVKVVA